MSLNEHFRKFSVWASNGLGAPWVFVINVLLILLWAASGPFADFSDTWQLIVNTATTVFTYLAVFLIRNHALCNDKLIRKVTKGRPTVRSVSY